MTKLADPNSASLLLVEDDAVFADRLRRNLELARFNVTLAVEGKNALALMQNQTFDLVVTDVKMPGMDGVELIRQIKVVGVDGVDPDVPVVVLTSVGSVETAVEAMKYGASDYIANTFPSAPSNPARLIQR